jgi:hypothetical protein
MFILFNSSGNLIDIVIVYDVFFTVEDVVYITEIYSSGRVSNKLITSEDLDELEKTHFVKWSEK